MIKTLRIACMELSPRCGGSSLCMEEDMAGGFYSLPDKKDFYKTAEERCISEMPRNITLGLFRQPFPSLYLRNDNAETTQRFRILLSPPQPPFECLGDVAAHAEHLPPSQPTTSVAFEDFVSQRKSSCPSLSQQNLQQQHPTLLVPTAL